MFSKIKNFNKFRLTFVILAICVTVYYTGKTGNVILIRDISPYSVKKSVSEVKTFFNQSIPPPGILINTTSYGRLGTGNQLYVYACSYTLAKDKNWPLYVIIRKTNISSNPNRTFAANRRDFSLDKFQIPELNLYDRDSIAQNVHVVKDADYLDGHLPEVKNDGFIQLQGNCESRQFFIKYEEEIKRMFQLPESVRDSMSNQMKYVLRDIEETESVALHVRRGDTLTYRGGNAFYVPISYHRSAIRRMAKTLQQKNSRTPIFFVFSDDIDFTKRQFTDFEKNYRFVYVSEMNTTSLQDLYLMTKCKNIIFASSTFGWWAAFLNLNQEKVVIASAYNPEFWRIFKEGRERSWRRKMNGQFYHPSSWIVIDPFSGEQ